MNNHVAANWYERFFSGINCETLEKAYSQKWTKGEVAFLADSLNAKQGDQFLDVSAVPEGIMCIHSVKSIGC